MHRINVKDLKYNKHQLLKIDRHIRDILSTIDDEIRDAHDTGKINIKYSLPHAFNIENLTSGESRRRIHANIISDLAFRGFLIHYIKVSQKYYLLITWITEEERYKKEKEINILKYFQQPIDNRNIDNSPKINTYKGIESLV